MWLEAPCVTHFGDTLPSKLFGCKFDKRIQLSLPSKSSLPEKWCRQTGSAATILHGVWLLALNRESECPRAASQLIFSRTLMFEQPRSGAPRSRIQSFDFTLEVAKIWQTITVVINQLHVLIFQNSISLLILLKNMKVTKKPFIIVCIISKFKWHVDEIEMLKALAHYNWNCKKEVTSTQTKIFFLRTATVFATVSYMGNDFSPKLQCLMIHFTVAITILDIYLDSYW